MSTEELTVEEKAMLYDWLTGPDGPSMPSIEAKPVTRVRQKNKVKFKVTEYIISWLEDDWYGGSDWVCRTTTEDDPIYQLLRKAGYK